MSRSMSCLSSRLAVALALTTAALGVAGPAFASDADLP